MARWPPARGSAAPHPSGWRNSSPCSEASSTPTRPGRRLAARNTLTREFFDRPAQEVGPALLGCVLEHATADGLVAVALSEVEAYGGSADPASHAYRGITARNAVMFGPPGHAYVYFTYGMHFCVNVVCGPPGVAEAVLLRAGRVIVGEELARRRRGFDQAANISRDPAEAPGYPARAYRDRARMSRDLARGPACLCQALAIDRSLDGVDLCDPAAELRLSAAGSSAPSGGTTLDEADLPRIDVLAEEKQPRINVGPRVGITKAADTPWRFWLAKDPTVSAYRRGTLR